MGRYCAPGADGRHPPRRDPAQARGEYLRSGLRFRLRYLAAQRAARVIVPTRAVADDAMRTLEIPAERIAVIGKAAAPTLHGAPTRRSRRCVSASRCRRSTCCGSAGSEPPSRASGCGARKGQADDAARARRRGRTLGAELPDVTLTGQVTDDELAAIYTGAHALVFPATTRASGCRRWRRWRAGRRSPRATCRRCARCSTAESS